MSKKNDDFFKVKKEWSIVKDDLLSCYFKPYVTKILHTHHPLIYVDCFAGKGKFDDGKLGSPLIAMEIIRQCKAETTMANTNVEATFIDLNYAEELRENLKDYPFVNIISGKYEDNINGVLCGKRNYNVFLYIDPYGIKSLSCTQFDQLAKSSFNTIELLINMNSFGFIREASRVMGISFEDDNIFTDLVEYDSVRTETSDKSIKELNDIAGGDYWQQIIEQMKKGDIDGYRAESIFAEEYCRRLRKSFRYVLNMPLRIRKGQRPKYRLIHITNKSVGCILMVDNICNRWEALQQIQADGQLQLFQENFDNQTVNSEEICLMTEKYFAGCTGWMGITDALADFFVVNGPICKTGTVTKILRKMEDQGKIEVSRWPAHTSKGKPTTFMNENSKQSVKVRWRQ